MNIESIEPEKRTFYYGVVFILSLGTIALSGFLIGSIIDNYNFNEHGVSIQGTVNGIERAGKDGYLYEIQYTSNGKTMTGEIYSLYKFYDIYDKVAISLVKETNDICFTDELDAYGFDMTLLLLSVLFALMLLFVLKRPDLITRFNGELDELG